MDAEGGAGGFEQPGHAEGKGVADFRTFEGACADQVAEMVGLVVKTTVTEGLFQFNFAGVAIVNGGADGIPPVGVEDHVAAGGCEQRIALAEQVEAGIELGHAALVLGLDEGQGVHSGRFEATHGLHAFEGAEPVEREKGLVGTDAHNAATTQFCEVQGVIGREGGVCVAGADEADGADGVGEQVAPQAPVEGKDGRLHGFYEEPVVTAGHREDTGELALVERGGLFTENVLAGFESLKRELGVSVGVGCDVDCVDVAGQEPGEGIRRVRHAKAERISLDALAVSAPDRLKSRARDGLESFGETRSGATRPYDAPSNQLRSFHLLWGVPIESLWR